MAAKKATTPADLMVIENEAAATITEYRIGEHSTALTAEHATLRMLGAIVKLLVLIVVELRRTRAPTDGG